MRCPNCHSENPDSKKFCSECGAELLRRCPKCSADNAPAAKFCGECGAALADKVQADPAKSLKAASPIIRITAERANGANVLEGERKTVTALFADIKGSTELMEDLDPEEARAIIDPALKLMIDAVHRYDGYVVQSTGDGIFALFGAPLAHEDHPQRALYAALRMQEEMSRYSAKVIADGGMPIEARVGVNTGEVVVRSIRTGAGQTEYTPIGHTTNLAARMQAVAPTGSIAISEQTCKFVEGYFQLKARGPTRVKGVSEPVSVYEVTGLGPLRTRLQRAAGRGFTKFVGRERELEALKHAGEQTKLGHGQLVAVMAEPGVGKSRLYFEFKATSQAGWMVLETFSVSHGKASAYLPVIDLLRNYFKIASGDDERTRREKVAGRLSILDPSLADARPYLFSLLGIVDGPDPLAQMDGQLKKRRTLEAIKRILLRESLNQPLMMIFEDLHWIDEATQEFLNLLADSLGTAKLLLLVNYRPEYSHQWGSKTCYTQLRLDPLGLESADQMLSALVGDSPELAPIKRLVIERTEGNPFFMEEIVQSLFEDGALQRNGSVKLARLMNAIKVPATVQGVLAARIDRLPAEAKDLLQTLAVIGREFPLSLIRAMLTKPGDELNRLLSDLQLGEFIHEQPATGDTEYIFKHALTLEVGYNSMLIERRRLLHERAGQAIEALFSDRLEDHLSELAHHYDRSGNVSKAVEYLGRAGRLAALQTAYPEAVIHLKRALVLLRNLPDNADRGRQEFDLQMALSWSLFVVNQVGPEREPVLVRALELSEQLGENAKHIEALLQLAHFRMVRREYHLARELAEQVLGLAEPATAPAMVVGAHFLLGATAFYFGELLAAREHHENAIALLGPEPFRNFGETQYAQLATGALPLTLLFLGYPASALKKGGEFLAAMRRLSDPAALAGALMREVVNRQFLRDSRTALERAEELSTIATEHGMSFHMAIAGFAGGWALTNTGLGAEGLAQMSKALPALEGFGATPLLYAVLAETYCKNGHPEEGLKTVATAFRETQRGGEIIADTELHRVNGELLLIRDPPEHAAAEVCFRTAIEVACGHAAKLYELRATISLTRLLKSQGRRDEARTMLAAVYNWFTEGFETADLIEAKALLDELSG